VKGKIHKLMGMIEKYTTDHPEGPRPCQQTSPSVSAKKCFAELIYHPTLGREEFLCKKHAADKLSGNRDAMAQAVVELYLR
jgi:hypothetical protein